jgi:tRNA nucleotidyltransferase (CCA-adding enzyme)
MALEKEVLDKISPSPERRRDIDRKVRALLARTEDEARKEGIGLDVTLVGSVAKDTFLREPDIDIFLLFPEGVPRARLEAIGLELGRRILGAGEERYAEHPYIHGMWEGLEVDMVPCYHIKDTTRLMSAVDRTPFHTHYVKANLRDEQKDQVRLLKQFAKGVGVYGAEAKTQGLSGYLIELLTMRYGSFRDVLEAASKWRKGTVLGLDDRGVRKFNEPLVFYDPVDRNRNVASALSCQSLAVFIHASRSYLQVPSDRYFFPHPREPLDLRSIGELLKERGTGVVVATMERPELIDDNLYPQVRRSLDGLCALLESNDFKIIDRAHQVAEVLRFVVELEALTLSPVRRHTGPPAWIGNATSFLERWNREGVSRPFLEDGRWMVIAPRLHPAASDLVRSRFSTAALGSDLRGLNGLEVEGGPCAIREENRAALSALLDKRLNWEVE